MKIEPRTLKGFKDYLPKDARKRQYIVTAFRKVFESFGFEPLETPHLEYEEILSGKYGEEGEKLMYKFIDNGERKVALRYDQTVPLARVISQYKNDLPLPFKRYQISNVFRGENTQKGRLREFTQCDIDIVGAKNVLADAEIIACAAKCLEILGFEKYKILINDRSVFKSLSDNEELKIGENELMPIIQAVDKLKKIGREKVIEEIESRGIEKARATKIIDAIETSKKPQELEDLFSYLEQLGISTEKFEFVPVLARGLDYYTGTIFEIEVEDYNAGSVCGGGRYDNLIGIFSDETIPAVGCAFGFNRLFEAMEQMNLFPDLTKTSTTRVLVTVFSKDLIKESIKLLNYIRNNGLNAEIYPDFDEKLEKQIKFADKKTTMYAAILGPEEVKNNTVTIKNLRIVDQQTIAREDLLKVI